MTKYVREDRMITKHQIITYTCDICHEEFDPEDNLSFISEKFIGWGIKELPMVFHTDQNDGSYIEPYWSTIPMPDLCPSCANKMFPMYATGCQGYNEFHFKDDTNE